MSEQRNESSAAHTASRAQALLLGCIEEHEQRDEPVYAYQGERTSLVTLLAHADDHGPLHGVDFFVPVDHTLAALVPASLPCVRRVTLDACGRRRWISDGGVDEFETQRLGTCWFHDARTVRLRRIGSTDGGRRALEAYRRLPISPEPTLGGVERQIVELAVQAERFGYALLPVTEEAKRGARALARTPFAKRGWGAGASTRSLEATATGEVELVG